MTLLGNFQDVTLTQSDKVEPKQRAPEDTKIPHDKLWSLFTSNHIEKTAHQPPAPATSHQPSSPLLNPTRSSSYLCIHSYLALPHCIALHCTALQCSASYAPHYTALHCTALHGTALQHTALQRTALHRTHHNPTTVHCTELHFCSALQCINFSSWLQTSPVYLPVDKPTTARTQLANS